MSLRVHTILYACMYTHSDGQLDAQIALKITDSVQQVHQVRSVLTLVYLISTELNLQWHMF